MPTTNDWASCVVQPEPTAADRYKDQKRAEVYALNKLMRKKEGYDEEAKATGAAPPVDVTDSENEWVFLDSVVDGGSVYSHAPSLPPRQPLMAVPEEPQDLSQEWVKRKLYAPSKEMGGGYASNTVRNSVRPLTASERQKKLEHDKINFMAARQRKQAARAAKAGRQAKEPPQGVEVLLERLIPSGGVNQFVTAFTAEEEAALLDRKKQLEARLRELQEQIETASVVSSRASRRAAGKRTYRDPPTAGYWGQY